MKWMGRRESDNVEDRRGMSGGGKIAIGGGVIGILVLVFQLFMGGDSSELLNQVQQQMQQGQSSAGEQAPLSAEEEEMGRFVKVMLADNEDVWHKQFARIGREYVEPGLILFRGATQSACGQANSATGPFYCPADQKVYMDLGFFDDLKNKLGAEGGDFAIAYVIAHEVGHHVQHLLGTTGQMRKAQEQSSEAGANQLSVALELQADFYAGVWAHDNNKMTQSLEPGDIEEALSAAAAVGDDHIQKRSQGYVVPESFTHGSSEQRMYWFKRGFESGDLRMGDTFKELR